MPGEEFRVALREAHAIGAQVGGQAVLGRCWWAGPRPNGLGAVLATWLHAWCCVPCCCGTTSLRCCCCCCRRCGSHCRRCALVALRLQVVLGDRELTITLARVWHSLSCWEKIKLTSTLLWTGIRCVWLTGGSSSC